MAAKRAQSPKKAQAHAAGNSRSEKLRLAGKVAVITGGSSGIGLAVGRAFAEEGCSVVITGRRDDKLVDAAARLSAIGGPGKIVALLCDVRDAASVNGLFDEVRERFGHIDILVNNAGISHPATPLEETSLELWQAVIATNLTGKFLCTRAALPLMQRGGTIINNLSAAARQIFPQYYAYTAAKMGALGFTLSLREELKPRGIRVLALLPGATDTDIWLQIMPNAPRQHMIDVYSVAQAVLYAVLLPPNVNASEISLDPMGGAI